MELYDGADESACIVRGDEGVDDNGDSEGDIMVLKLLVDLDFGGSCAYEV